MFNVYIVILNYYKFCGAKVLSLDIVIIQAEILERAEGIKREYNELDTVWFMAGSLFQAIYLTKHFLINFHQNHILITTSFNLYFC